MDTTVCTSAEAATILRSSRCHVLRLFEKGVLNGYRDGKEVLFFRQSVEDYSGTPQSQPVKFINTKQACDILDLGRARVIQLFRDGKIRGQQESPRHKIHLEEDSVREYLDSVRSKPTPQEPTPAPVPVQEPSGEPPKTTNWTQLDVLRGLATRDQLAPDAPVCLPLDSLKPEEVAALRGCAKKTVFYWKATRRIQCLPGSPFRVHGWSVIELMGPTKKPEPEAVPVEPAQPRRRRKKSPSRVKDSLFRPHPALPYPGGNRSGIAGGSSSSQKDG